MNQSVVLYVEDESADVFFMEKAFRRAGITHTLLSVDDGEKAISYLAGESVYNNREKYPLPMMVLLDLNLPLRSGFEVLEWLRQQPHFTSLPVVIFSSSGRPEDKDRAQRLGANDYLLKPSSAMDFIGTARILKESWLEKRR